MILFSACLLGKNCKYNGGNNEVEKLVDYYQKHGGVLVCPEQLGGLSTPRIPCEQCNGKVVNQEGLDVTEEFMTGAKKALDIAKKHNCKVCVLKKNSPSCSPSGVYDGTFSHTKIDGMGVFAEMAKESGLIVLDENEAIEYLYGSKKVL